MDALSNLKLRKPDISSILSKKHDQIKSVKREHIKEILLRNIRKQYTSGDAAEDELDITVGRELDKFLEKNPHSINAKDLAAF
jgi:hypothetical protein